METESMRAPGDPFNGWTLDALRTRRSEKWTTYPPDVLPAFVAEMDVALAEPITHALLEAIARGDTGYASPHPVAVVWASSRGRSPSLEGDRSRPGLHASR